ncbi:MAG: hypothetical protein PHD61_13055 [Bacteroidales bacterium]|nr:hypothetical protein [Lentimicrobiaceae bacterium]MDD5696217.1 hypothetical protein [Bacteroidales bacterium]
MRKFISVLLNPWALAIPFAILVILFLPPVTKYKAAIKSRESLPGTCFFFSDLDGDGHDDLVFYISARYSIAPRQVHVYDIHQDMIRRSGSFGNNLLELKVADINGDGYYEVMGNSMTRSEGTSSSVVTAIA